MSAEWRRDRRAFTKLGWRRRREVARLARRGERHPDQTVAQTAYRWAAGTVLRRLRYVIAWVCVLGGLAAWFAVAGANPLGPLWFSFIPLGMSWWWWPVADRIVRTSEAARRTTQPRAPHT